EHELAHIFLYKKSRGADIPRWMDEGFAMMQSREWRIGLDIIVVRALFTGSFIPLPQIESLNQFDDSKAQLAYVESYLAFSYLLDEYGKESFFDLLNQLSMGNNLESAFLKTTGSSYTGFQLEFLSYLKKRYNIFALLGDTFLFWLILAFLVIFLYFIKKQRNRKTLKKWEYEDKIGKYGYYEEDQTQD
ncbi:MAG: peptidase MA family metallohydrolase, partial [candidate division Zixibacteria bacterium]|nr:peptidase MA family metallohydrolase [candidate division Zixibacteria bacterium]